MYKGTKADSNKHLLMHAMASNVSGIIGSMVTAVILLSFNYNCICFILGERKLQLCIIGYCRYVIQRHGQTS